MLSILHVICENEVLHGKGGKIKEVGFALLIGCTSSIFREPICDVLVRNLQQK